MVDLFKKKQNNTPKTPKPAKKPLFGKKKSSPQAMPPDDNLGELPPQAEKPIASPKKSKKLGKSFGAKKETNQGTSTLDDNKLKKIIMVLVVLFVLAVLGLIATMFLGGEEPIESTPPVTTTQNPEPATPSAPEPVATESAEPVAQTETAIETPPNNQPASAQPTNSDTSAQQATTNTVAPSAPASRTISREEFLQETQNRVYRERDTSPP